MPTATQTTTAPATSPAAALRALYPAAARAFLDRNFDATQTAVDDALALLGASPVLPGQPDELAGQRRKWDMLRVTLQTTVYGQPASKSGASKRFSGLRQLMPQALVASMHARSVQLFTPHALKPSSAFLPPQVLVNLVLAALKLDCPQGARSIAEDWLAAQHAEQLDADSVREYEKVVQVYCIHVLPRLAEWDLAADHLHTNHMLPDDARRHLLKSLRAARAAADAQPPPSPATPSASSTRASTPTSDSTVTPQRVASPTPSSSSAETSSTRTARPAARNSLAVTSLARRPSTPPQEHASTSTAPPTPSASSQLTITPQRSRLSRLTSPPPSSTSRASSRRPLRPQTASELLELVRTTLAPHIARIASSRFALFLLFVLFPVLAGLLRFRWARRRPRTVAALTAPSIAGVFPADPAQLARERLKGASANWWSGAVRALVDTVRMASGGLT
ncbi:hypothetical protein AURDEDRAFT_143597 [Auricularia subglabra TFB-10046 SS5]|nr:hypothetical protein AURDEDRAFT_143597 [Auricularia subglabra TFB-10046 SS5]